MSRYAESTTVPSDRSRAEIERTLTRYGASGFMYGWSGQVAQIAFEAHSRRVLFRLPLPEPAEFATTERGRARRPAAAEKAYEQAQRQRWRALALAIKAKLECVETGITTFEEEFLAHIMLPDGATVAEHALPTIATAYETGAMQPLLPAPPR